MLLTSSFFFTTLLSVSATTTSPRTLFFSSPTGDGRLSGTLSPFATDVLLADVLFVVVAGELFLPGDFPTVVLPTDVCFFVAKVADGLVVADFARALLLVVFVIGFLSAGSDFFGLGAATVLFVFAGGTRLDTGRFEAGTDLTVVVDVLVVADATLLAVFVTAELAWEFVPVRLVVVDTFCVVFADVGRADAGRADAGRVVEAVGFLVCVGCLAVDVLRNVVDALFGGRAEAGLLVVDGLLAMVVVRADVGRLLVAEALELDNGREVVVFNGNFRADVLVQAAAKEA